MKTSLKHTILTAAAILGGWSAIAQASSPRVEALIGKMTLDEKVGQLNQLSGYGYNPAMTTQIRKGQVGSILNETDPEVVNKLQRVAVDSTRLGIPLVFARDVIHGFRTIFPIPLGQAATWNADLIRQGARISAIEAASAGIRWTFSPMVDISRDARWGRIAESFGEDPYLSSLFGVAMIRGYQGDNLADPTSIAACAKHFAGYGASEAGRDYNTTWIPEVQLRDTYLPPFKACADAGAATFMCSFNDINGVPSSANAHLIQDILRDDWGWKGMMVSDWASVQQMIPHGYAKDLRHAAELAANAGVDMDMENYAYVNHLRDLVEKGEVSMQKVDDMVRRVLELKEALGLFDNPYVDMKTANNFYSPEALQAAREAAEQSAVLLHNHGNVLPLANKPGRIAVAGPMANALHDQNGTWVFDMDKTRTVTPLMSLTEMYGKKNVVDAAGLAYSRDKDTSRIAESVAKAKDCDVILYFAGEEAVLSGEAHCRTDLTLPGAQREEIEALKATGKPLVVVVMSGRPLDITAQDKIADALIFWFHPGTMGGPAIANILSGKTNPSGRLPVCLPRSSGQMPLYYAQKNTGRPATEMVLIDDIDLEAGQTSTGCTSYYQDIGFGPFYPFGYGLGYSSFSYSDPRLSSARMTADGNIKVSCTVTNNGKYAGTETPQLYVRDMVGSLVRPVRELKGFERVTLQPGESRTVTFTLTPADLAFHHADLSYNAEPGDFQVWVASDSDSGNAAAFTLE